MKFQNLSVKRLFGRVAMELVLSMSGITISEHFAQDGKPLDSLLEDVIQHAAAAS